MQTKLNQDFHPHASGSPFQNSRTNKGVEMIKDCIKSLLLLSSITHVFRCNLRCTNWDYLALPLQIHRNQYFPQSALSSCGSEMFPIMPWVIPSLQSNCASPLWKLKASSTSPWPGRSSPLTLHFFGPCTWNMENNLHSAAHPHPGRNAKKTLCGCEYV